MYASFNPQQRHRDAQLQAGQGAENKRLYSAQSSVLWPLLPRLISTINTCWFSSRCAAPGRWEHASSRDRHIWTSPNVTLFCRAVRKRRTNLQSLVGSTEKHREGEQSAVLSRPDRATWGSATTCPCLCQSQSTWNPQTKDLSHQLRPFPRGPHLWKAHFAWAGRLAEAFSWVMCLELDHPAEVSAMARTSESMETCADSTPHP